MDDLFSSVDQNIGDACDGHAEYFADFFGAQADDYFEFLRDQIDWQEQEMTLYGKKIKIPRLTAWFSEEGKSYTYSGISQIGAPFPPAVKAIADKIKCETGYYFNSVLLNLYRDGRDKVYWHSDDEADLGDPADVDIASVSLGAERKFQLRHKMTGEKNEVPLQHGSLLIMHHPMQKFWEHQIPLQKGVQDPRINLTFRNIVS